MMEARDRHETLVNRYERELREAQIREAGKKVAAIDERLERVETIMAEMAAELHQIDELVKELVEEVRAGRATE